MSRVERCDDPEAVQSWSQQRKWRVAVMHSIRLVRTTQAPM